ncbi:putative Phage T7 F exclusion suppressor FxsA [uncultured delta proteobacterium]|uniref:Putative Phage T7 F exclusion suppressor FxsA n=1 Tax=uncultured delta proteobacterium TaxID=34034 RepID=A0A212KCE7_9DELT|nr:putative Phage T7 F exclusion suppressor FxsA [uncultured delta proteobacterium]
MRRFIPWLILLFPALELWVLIQVGKEIGALATVGLVIVSMFIGFGLLRLRGMHIAKTMQTELAAGRLPSGQIADTFCLMVAGWLFVFPGFVSDVLAVLLLIPGVRHILLSFAVAKMRRQGFQSQTVQFESSADGSGPVSWTCTTYGNAPGAEPERPELRGNAVIIDCEPEVITRDDDTSNNPKKPG